VTQDDDELWPLFRAVAERGEAAWPALLAALEPVLLAMARWQPVGRLRAHEDTPREIVTAVFARLHAREHALVTKLCAMTPPPVLRAWLNVIVRRSAIDFMRGSPEFERGTEAKPPRWVSLATLTSLAPSPAPASLVEQRALVVSTVTEMVQRAVALAGERGDDAFAQLALEWKIPRIHVRRLAKKGDQFLGVLGKILEGHQQADIADELGLTRREVELTVRYLEELLQARFGRQS
jgi:DNA-directed RNA polymerase specialized sigma24 family protein